MHPLQVVALFALSAFAVYRQSVPSRVDDGVARFKLPLIYACVGLFAGGFTVPQTGSGWVALAVGALVSAAVGALRGALTRVWLDAEGAAWSRGTPLSIALFVLLICGKFASGAYEQMHGGGSGGDRFGEVLVLIALMMIPQVLIVGKRVQAISARSRTGSSAEMLEQTFTHPTGVSQ